MTYTARNLHANSNVSRSIWKMYGARTPHTDNNDEDDGKSFHDTTWNGWDWDRDPKMMGQNCVKSYLRTTFTLRDNDISCLLTVLKVAACVACTAVSSILLFYFPLGGKCFAHIWSHLCHTRCMLHETKLMTKETQEEEQKTKNRNNKIDERARRMEKHFGGCC